MEFASLWWELTEFIIVFANSPLPDIYLIWGFLEDVRGLMGRRLETNGAVFELASSLALAGTSFIAQQKHP